MRQRTKRTTLSEKEIDEIGPLTSVFPCSESKILDHVVTMKGFDYSISDISRISGVNFKTTLGIVHKLEEQEVIKKTRNVGKAIMYKLNPDSAQAKSISSLAFEIAKKRISQIQ
ncbi:hypothetical protein [Candidatus Nitrosotenuis sp. DW1]|uniref:hypothetical protein n=1 Tax=Candidatus Nitrosotenuis sp. DW1 TaxID=2259672 RepID=UPI0015CD8B24|nr:hypothetical protein [Candidatus Nitrosotenuis sp. DW1]QLH08348.1 hypothetical protein DSQ19_01605 [Candidatus Nitrosotenuis sp. DW1]